MISRERVGRAGLQPDEDYPWVGTDDQRFTLALVLATGTPPSPGGHWSS